MNIKIFLFYFKVYIYIIYKKKIIFKNFPMINQINNKIKVILLNELI